MSTEIAAAVPAVAQQVPVLPFSFEGSAVRVSTVNGETWFVLADICGALEIANPARAASGLDDDEKGVQTVNTLGGPQEMTTVNESGMYTLVLRSRKPAAKRFRRFVTSTVLPSIRKHGAFVAVRPGESEESIAARISAAIAENNAHHGIETRRLTGDLIKTLKQKDQLRGKVERLTAENGAMNRRLTDAVRENAGIGRQWEAATAGEAAERQRRIEADRRAAEAEAGADLHRTLAWDIHAAAGRVIREKDAEIAELRAWPEPGRIEIDPEVYAKAMAYDRLTSTKDSFGVRESASVLRIGQAELVKRLKALGWVYTCRDTGGRLAGYATAVDRKLVTHAMAEDPRNPWKQIPTVFLTAKGLGELALLLGQDRAEVLAVAGAQNGAEAATRH